MSNIDDNSLKVIDGYAWKIENEISNLGVANSQLIYLVRLYREKKDIEKGPNLIKCEKELFRDDRKEFFQKKIWL